jgi:predicted HAD superfamily phosphohydrolase
MMTNANAAANVLTAKISEMETAQILKAVEAIGGGHVDTDARMVRAYLIEELIAREGVDAGDKLMDELGL